MNAGPGKRIVVHQVKYLNNIVEQDHRAIKRRTRPMLGFKDFRCARNGGAIFTNLRSPVDLAIRSVCQLLISKPCYYADAVSSSPNAYNVVLLASSFPTKENHRSMISRRDLLLSVLATTFTSMKTDVNAESRANVTHSTAPGSDLILHNGSILTLDDHSTQGEAIAIRGERVLSVGTNAAILRNQTRETKIIDLKGHSVVPGLIDVHAHMDREGLRRLCTSSATPA